MCLTQGPAFHQAAHPETLGGSVGVAHCRLIARVLERRSGA